MKKLVLTLAAAALAAACQRGKAETQVALVTKAMDSEFWLTVADGAKAAAAARPDVKLLIGAPDREINVDQQVSILEDQVRRGVKALVVSPAGSAQVMSTLEKMVKQHNIKNAVILSGIGSVRNYHIHSVSNREFPSKNIFVKNPVDPADIVSVNGYVIDGRVHAHMTMTNEHHAFGGHIEPETTVFTFAIVTLGVLNDEADLNSELRSSIPN